MQKQLAYIVSLLQSESRPTHRKTSPTYAQVAGRSFPERNDTRPVPPQRYMPRYDSQRERTRNIVVCFCCGREGHIARMCDVRCENCGRQGHKANRCYSRQQAPRKIFRFFWKKWTTMNGLIVRLRRSSLHLLMKIWMIRYSARIAICELCLC